MQYSISELSKIKAKVFAHIAQELEVADSEGLVDEFLEKYGIVFDEECIPVNVRTMKIIVFGDLAGNVNDYRMAAKKMGIDPGNIDFENDYARLTNFDSEKLKDSFTYSDLIMASNPHKVKNLGEFNSFTSKIKAEQSRYPRLVVSQDPHSLKLSITGFKECLLRTRYFENLEI